MFSEVHSLNIANKDVDSTRGMRLCEFNHTELCKMLVFIVEIHNLCFIRGKKNLYIKCL